MKVVERIILRLTFGVNMFDRIRDEYIRGSLRVTNIAGKMRKDRSRWFWHAERRNNDR